ncbi:MAG: VWA domain-containing protein, partial [Myxococcota bacterium]
MSRLPFVIGLLLAGCSSSDVEAPSAPAIPPGISGVGQGGAQDFGRFRQILDEGGIPGPDTLDDVGFFAEHKFELPAPDCGEDVCIHGMYGAMDNMIDGSVCTVVLVGMNTTLTPESVVRPPLDLTVVVDTSGSMSGQPIADVRRGLTDMLAVLQPDDRLSIVTFGTVAEVRVDRASVASPQLELAIQALDTAGSTNLYAGLRAGYELAAATLQPERQNRLLLLSDGVATIGI